MIEFVTKDALETKKVGLIIAEAAFSNGLILLTGDLGAGKTTLTGGIANGLGVNEKISSPTFTVVNEHHADNTNIYHFDVYRLEDTDEFYAIGGEEYFEKGASIIEWGELIEEALPKDYIKISFSRDLDNENLRKISVENIGNVEFLL